MVGMLDEDQTTTSLVAAERAPEVAPRRIPRILCVEDEPISLRLTSIIVERLFGVRIIAAETAEDGLAICETEPPDLVLMDVVLPGQSGIDAILALRANPKTAAIPVIVLSGYDSPEDIKCSLDAGATAHLSKPIDIPEFSRVVSKILAACAGA